MTTLICDFQSIVGKKIKGYATLTAGQTRPAYDAPSVVVHDPIEKEVVQGRAVFENVNPGDAVITVDWEDQSSTIRFVVPNSEEDIYLSDCITGDYFTPEEIDLLRWGIKEQISGARELIESTANDGMAGITGSIADYFSQAAETYRQTLEAAGKAEDALGAIEEKVQNTEAVIPALEQAVSDLNDLKSKVQDGSGKIVSAFELLEILQGLTDTALEKAGAAQTGTNTLAEEHAATLKEIERIQVDLGAATSETSRLSESLSQQATTTATKIQDVVDALADSNTTYEEGLARFAEAESQLQTLSYQYADAIERVAQANQTLEEQSTQLEDLALTAQTAYDALPGLRQDIETLTGDLSTTTGGLSEKAEELAGKVSALDSLTKQQGTAITSAKQTADKGVSDAATALSKANTVNTRVTTEVGTLNTKLATAKTEAANAATAAQTAAEKYAKEKSEADKAAAEVVAAAEALRVAQAEATAAKNAAAADATAKANAAQSAAETLAKAEAKAAQEAAELTAALDASEKANKAKTDAEAKAATLATAAKDAAATALTGYKNLNDPKVTAAKAAGDKGIADAKAAQIAADQAALDATNKSKAAREAAELYAKEKSEADTAASLVTSAAEALRVAKLQADAAKAAASTDAKTKADEAERLAKVYAAAQATAAREAAEATAAADAKAKADAAKIAAEGTAKTLADAAKSAANTALTSYKSANDPKVSQAQTDASKGISDAAAAKSRADKAVTDASAAQAQADKAVADAKAAADKLPDLTVGVSNAAAAAKAANDALPKIRTDISSAKNQADKGVTDAANAKAAVDNLQIGGRNLLLKSGGDLVLSIRSNSGASYPITQGKDEIGEWVSGYLTETPEFFTLNTYVNPAWESGVGTHYSRLISPADESIVQSVEVMSPDYDMEVRIGNTGTRTLIKAGIWQRIRYFTPSHAARPSGLYVNVSQDIPADTKLYHRLWKFEVGSKATDWTPAPEDTQVEIDALINKADDLTTGLAGAATQEQYNELNTRLWGDQGQINKLQGEINENNSAFQTWQTEVNGRRDTWENGATLAINHLTNFATEQAKWNKASTDATKALSDAGKAQSAINAANKTFQDYQTEINSRRDVWEQASTEATKALADLAIEQGKVLAIQQELTAKRDKWESGATLAINHLTGFATEQAKWNKASTDATKALKDAAAAQKDVNDNNTAFQTWQTGVNQDRTKWENGATLALQHLGNFATEQAKWNKASSDATDALAKYTANQAKWTQGANLAISNLQTFAADQARWNKAASDVLAADAKANEAQNNAIDALKRAVGLARLGQSLITQDYETGYPNWADGMTRVTSDLPNGVSEGWRFRTTSTYVTEDLPGEYVTIMPNTRYRVEFWAKASKSGSGLMFIFLKPDGNYYLSGTNTGIVVDGGGYVSVNPVTTDWVLYEGSITFTGVDRIKLGLLMHQAIGEDADITLAGFRIYPDIPSQAEVDELQNKALTAAEEFQEEQKALNIFQQEVNGFMIDAQNRTSEMVMKSMIMNLNSSTPTFTDPENYFRIYNNDNNVDIEALTTNGSWVGRAILTLIFGTSHETSMIEFNVPDGVTRRSVRSTQTRNNRKMARLDWWVYKKEQKIETKTEPGTQYAIVGKQTRTALNYTAKVSGEHIIEFELDWVNTAKNGRLYTVRIKHGNATLKELAQKNLGPNWPWEDGRRRQKITWRGDLPVNAKITFEVEAGSYDMYEPSWSSGQLQLQNIQRKIVWMQDRT